MAFSDVFKSGGATKTKGFSSLFKNLPEEQLQRRHYIAQLENEAQVAKQASDYENSFTGLKSLGFGSFSPQTFATDLGERIVNVPKDFISSLYDIYRNTPTKIAQSIQTGAEDAQKGKVFATTIAGARVAGDTGIAVYAPISAAIGAVLKATGGQELLDDTGQVIADASGITDIPAFQKFAMDNPEAGADFERILMFAMAGFERGTINPGRMYSEANAFVNKLTTLQKPPPGGSQMVVHGKPQHGAAKPDVVAKEHLDTAKRAIDAGEPEAGVVQNAKNNIKMALESYGLVDEAGYIGSINSSNMTLPQFTSAVNSSLSQGTAVVARRPVRTERAPAAETQIATRGEPVRAPNTRAQALERAAVERKLTQGFGELPTHNRMNLALQAEDAVRFIEENIEEALRVAKGEVLPPQGLLAESVYTALEARAIRTGDATLARELMQSRVPTLAGQAIKALDSADPNSPIKILRDIQTALEARIERRGGRLQERRASEVSAARREVSASASKRPTWEAFINELTCGY